MSFSKAGLRWLLLLVLVTGAHVGCRSPDADPDDDGGGDAGSDGSDADGGGEDAADGDPGDGSGEDGGMDGGDDGGDHDAPLPDWETERLPAGFWDVSVGIDAAGTVHIVAGGVGDIHWMRRAGGEWTVSSFDRSDPRHVAMALHDDGRPVIAYYRWDYEDAFYEEWTGSEWEGHYISSWANTVKLSLAIDGADQVQLAYYDADEMELYFGPLGGEMELVAGRSAVGPSLAIDSGGSPVIAFNQSGSGMRLATRSGTEWAVSEISGSGGRNSLALGPGGAAHVCWVVDDDPWDFPDTPDEVHYATGSGTSWTATTLTSNALHGTGCAVAVDGDGEARVLYVEGAAMGSIVLAHGGGGTFSRTTLEPSCVEAATVSADVDERALVIDGEGRTHAAYRCQGASYARSNVPGM